MFSRACRSLAQSVVPRDRVPLPIVYCAYVDKHVERDNRRLMALEHDKTHAVGEFELGYILFELGQVLRAEEYWSEEQQTESAHSFTQCRVARRKRRARIAMAFCV
jgi:hypothetical protein